MTAITLLPADLPAAAELATRVTLLLVAGWVTTGLLRRRSAGARHAVWSFTLAGVLALPVLGTVVPEWRVPLAQPLERLSWMPEWILGEAPLDARPAPDLSPADAEAPSPAVPPLQLPLITKTIAGIWVAGTLAVLVVFGLGQLEMLLVLRRSRPAGGTWREETRRTAEAVGLRRPVRVLVGPDAAVPMTWGLRRSVMLLPTGAEHWSAPRRRSVLLHELAHVARHDCALEWVSWIACALYWFHPGVWYAARRIRVEREQACDDFVVSAGTPAEVYATHLVDVAESIVVPRRRALAAPAMAAGGNLEARLHHLLDHTRPRVPLGRSGRLAIGAATLALVAAVAALQPDGVSASSASMPPAPRSARDSLQFPISPEGTVSWSGPIFRGDTLAVRAAMGSIVVDSAGGGEVRVTAVRRVGPRGREADTRVGIVRRGSTLTICSIHMAGGRPVAPCEVSDDWGRGSVDDNDVTFHVSAPPGVHLDLMTGLGDVRALAVRGDVRALTGNGRADIATDGAATVDAYSGGIGYTMLAGASAAPVLLRVKHGVIDIRFDSAASATYDLSPGRGTVRMGFSSGTQGTDRSVRGTVGTGRRPLVASLEKGDITVSMISR